MQAPCRPLPTPGSLTKEFDIDGLVESALKSFVISERWCHARKSSNHPLAVSTVDKIVTQAKEYIIAIDMSVETAAKGCAFTDDALALCDFIRTEHVPVEHLERFLKDMLQTANSAHESALAMNTKFKEVRKAIFQITRNIPQDVDMMRLEKTNISHNSVVAVPAPLPLLDITEESTIRQELCGIGREMEEMSFDEILTQLGQAEADLIELAERVGHFADWWNSVKMSLQSLQTAIPLITPDNSNPLRELVVRNRWERARSNYIQYQSRISVIKDYYPKLSPDAHMKPTGKVCGKVMGSPSSRVSAAKQPTDGASRESNILKGASGHLSTSLPPTYLRNSPSWPHTIKSAGIRKLLDRQRKSE